MLAAMGLDEEPGARPGKRAAADADAAPEPTRRSRRNEGKQVFYGNTPHQTPISALITSSITTLGERAAHGLPWPTLAQLVRPSLLEDPRIEQTFPLVRTSTQNLLKSGKLRRSVVSLDEEQQSALKLNLGDPRRTRTALRVLVMHTMQVQTHHMGEWDVRVQDEPTEEEALAASEVANHKATQRVLALEKRMREGAEESMDILASKFNTELDIQRNVAEGQQTATAQAEAPPTPWIPTPDVLPELQRDGDTAAANDSDDEWQEEKVDPALDLDTTPGCRVELMCSMTTIRSRVRRVSVTDPFFFSLPPGWTRVPDESRTGRRRTQMVYSRIPNSDGANDMAEVQAEEEDMDLNRATMTRVLRLMKELKSADCAWPFLQPVSLDDVPGYADVVETPMDLSTVQSKLDSGTCYLTLNALAADLRLISTNCIKFNAGAEGAEEYVQNALAFERQVERQLAVVRGADEDAGVVRHRPDLEDLLEKDWDEDEHGPWLGHVSNGKWEIRSGCMAEALQAIVDSLVDDGLLIGLDLAAGKVLDALCSPAKASPPPKKKQRGRKAKILPKPIPKKVMDGYVCANRYTLGESFKVRNARRAAANGNMEVDAAEDEKEEEEEELNEYERERQENILRNQAFLASLGLA